MCLQLEIVGDETDFTPLFQSFEDLKDSEQFEVSFCQFCVGESQVERWLHAFSLKSSHANSKRFNISQWYRLHWEFSDQIPNNDLDNASNKISLELGQHS